MKKKRGNPNWGNPELHSTLLVHPNSFEEVVKKLRLSPVEYESSIQLQDWARKNKDQKYGAIDSAPSMGLGR